MDEIQRSLGKLEGTVTSIREDVQEIKNDVKLLSQFKYRVAGGAAVLSVLVAFLSSFVLHWFKKGN